MKKLKTNSLLRTLLNLRNDYQEYLNTVIEERKSKSWSTINAENLYESFEQIWEDAQELEHLIDKEQKE